MRESYAANLDVLPKVFKTSVIVLVGRPFTAIDGDLARKLHAGKRHLGQMLHLVDILLAYLFALLPVIKVESSNNRRYREEDEPVP